MMISLSLSLSLTSWQLQSINDVICGALFLGTRLYMKAMNEELKNGKSTALVLLNTRNIGGYKSISEMMEHKAESAWGNQFAFLHVSLPKLTAADPIDPLSFVLNARKAIKKKRDSAAVLLTGKLLETMRKWRGPEVTARYIHGTLKNTSMTISNIMGPLERMALSNQPIKGMYFMVVGVPQVLIIPSSLIFVVFGALFLRYIICRSFINLLN